LGQLQHKLQVKLRLQLRLMLLKRHPHKVLLQPPNPLVQLQLLRRRPQKQHKQRLLKLQHQLLGQLQPKLQVKLRLQLRLMLLKPHPHKVQLQQPKLPAKLHLQQLQPMPLKSHPHKVAPR
jgi:hypothetical protein